MNIGNFLKTLLTTSSCGCFFVPQDGKHQNTLWQLRAVGSLFDGKYSKDVSEAAGYRGVFRTHCPEIGQDKSFAAFCLSGRPMHYEINCYVVRIK